MVYIDLNLYSSLQKSLDETFLSTPTKDEIILKFIKKKHLKDLIEKGIDVNENKRELEILYFSR